MVEGHCGNFTNSHGVGSSINSDWFVNSFTMVVYESFVFKGRLKYFSQTTIIKLFTNQSELIKLPTPRFRQEWHRIKKFTLNLSAFMYRLCVSSGHLFSQQILWFDKREQRVGIKNNSLHVKQEMELIWFNQWAVVVLNLVTKAEWLVWKSEDLTYWLTSIEKPRFRINSYQI